MKINKVKLLSALLLCLSINTGAISQINPTINKQAEQKDLTKQQKMNLLNKIGYGVTKKDLDNINTTNYHAWVNKQLEVKNPIIGAIENKNPFGTNLNADREDFFRNYKKIDFILSEVKQGISTSSMVTKYVENEIGKRMDYAIYSENRVNEMLVWFWFNHFNIGPRSQNVCAIFLDDYESKIRKQSLGKFKDLLATTSHHPAMLYYLNNNLNTYQKNDDGSSYINEINENYAREFLELHTMGVNNGYTQKDVQELAKILSGHGLIFLSDYENDINLDKVSKYTEIENLFKKKYSNKKEKYILENFYLFREDQHFQGDKILLGKKIKSNNEKELNEVINIVSSHPETAKFISKKLAIFFMKDDPSIELVNKMAKKYLESDTDIKETLKVLFYSDEFVKSLNKPSKIKDPYTYTLSTMKTIFKRDLFNDEKFKKDIKDFLIFTQADPYYKITPEGFSVYGKDWLSTARLHENLYIAVIQTFLNKKEELNYEVLSELANKKISNVNEALLFLTSDNWLKR